MSSVAHKDNFFPHVPSPSPPLFIPPRGALDPEPSVERCSLKFLILSPLLPLTYQIERDMREAEAAPLPQERRALMSGLLAAVVEILFRVIKGARGRSKKEGVCGGGYVGPAGRGGGDSIPRHQRR